MFRFAAGEEEIIALLKFLGQRAGGGVMCLPLLARHRDDLRFRVTIRPLAERLGRDERGMAWGFCARRHPPERLFVARNEERLFRVDPEASRLILLDFGPVVGGERRREAVIETRDWVHKDTPEELAPASVAARKLVEKCARRMRRRGVFDGWRWQIP
jgi:hypothetical protein